MRMVLIYAFIIAWPRPIVKHHFSVGYIFCFWDMMADSIPAAPSGAEKRFPRGEAVMEIAFSDFHD